MHGKKLQISFGNYEPKQWGRLHVAVQTNRSTGDAYVSRFARTEAQTGRLDSGSLGRRHKRGVWIAVHSDGSTNGAFGSPFVRT